VSQPTTSDEAQQLAAMVRAVFADHPTPVFSPRLWSTLTELGLTRLTLPEAAGGSGGCLADAASVLLVAGQAAAPVPLAETDLLAGWLLHTAGLAVPDGVLAIAADPPLTPTQDAPAHTQPTGREDQDTVGADGQPAVHPRLTISPAGHTIAVSGRLPRTGWARHAHRVVVLAASPHGPDLVLSIDPTAAGVRLRPGSNLAGEPRDELTLDLRLSAENIGQAPANSRELLARRAALARALLLAGAAGAALAHSVRYAGERVQFGRPIGRFQAVQQQLALAAAEVAAARAAVDAAVRIAATGTDGTPLAGPDAELAIAVAKARTSEAATVIARTAHQIHGAIGFTHEHHLRLATTRLWAWRDEDGDQTHWHTTIARQALTQGPDGLWPLLTRAN
jgi:acyl-CoA dehydrogenase